MSFWRPLPALVVIDCAESDIRRIERTGDGYRVTHTASFEKGWSITPGVIEQFRVAPPDKFSTKIDFIEADLTPCA